MKKIFVVLFCFKCSLLYAQQFYEKTPEAMHWVDSVFNSLNDKQRVAQLFVLRLSGTTANGVAFYDKEVMEAVQKYNIGAVCPFQGGPAKLATIINNLQQAAKTPLMVCIDGETGLGMRMLDSVMKLPDQITMGAINDADLLFRIGKAMGRQCKRAGIQVDYAPVADINNNPANPVINFRSLGEDKYKVALYATQIMKGLQSENVMACAKHFPGHGDVAVDSHFDLPVINKSRQQLDSLELYPFRQLFANGIGSVMIAHLSIPAIDTTKNLPTSLSKNNIQNLLRNELGFQGISFTDALEMKGVAKYYPGSEGSLQSLIAGNDMLCLPGDVPGSIDKIMAAIKKKQLSKDDMYARVKKVLLAKYHLGLMNAPVTDIANLQADLNAEIPALRNEVAEKAITLLRNDDAPMLLLDSNNKTAYIAIGISSANTIAKKMKEKYGADVFFFGYNDDETKANSLVQSIKKKYDRVIVGVHKLGKYPGNNYALSRNAIQFAANLNAAMPVLTMVFGNPYSAKNFCNAANLAICYEDDSIFQEAAFNWLSGKFTASGKLPVTICGQYKYGSGIAQAAAITIPATDPASAGFNTALVPTIDSIVNDAITQKAFPGCVVLVAKDGKIVMDKAYGFTEYNGTDKVSNNMVFDLASVTKISATTVSVMKLFEQGKIDLKKNLGDYLPLVRGTDKATLPIEDILLHQAGLNPFIPFYKETIDTLTGIPKQGFYRTEKDSLYKVQVAESMYMRSDWTDTMMKRILQSKMEAPHKYLYSDNDFIFLGKLVEQISGMPLNEYAYQNFYKPLQMSTTGFRPLNSRCNMYLIPTEQEISFRQQLLRGYVHDPGAAMFGGIAGHAGLFSNAYDLLKLYQMLLNGGSLGGIELLHKETIDYFTAYHSAVSRRGLGFDKPEKDNLTRDEPYPCLSASPETYGHTGYTGTCVWVDPAKNIVFIFLSNRVYPTGGINTKLGAMNIRGKIFEAIYRNMN